METAITRPKGFLLCTAISASPGNPKRMHIHRAKDVISFEEVSPEHAQIGAASRIDTSMGTLFVIESIEEISQRIHTAEKESEGG